MAALKELDGKEFLDNFPLRANSTLRRVERLEADVPETSWILPRHTEEELLHSAPLPGPLQAAPHHI